MIKSFKDADTETLFRLGRVRRFVNIERPALRKLKQLDLARRGYARSACESFREAFGRPRRAMERTHQ